MKDTVQQFMKHLEQESEAGRFLARILEDKEFAEIVLTQTEPDMVLTIAKENGFSLTAADLEETNRLLSALTGQSPNKDGELSEEDLEQVAGGTLFTSIEVPIMTATLTAITAMTISAVTSAGVTVVSWALSLITKQE